MSLFARKPATQFTEAQLAPAAGNAPPKAVISLAEVPAGGLARVEGFSTGMPAEKGAHLQAYGLSAGQRVAVVQHSPVTVVRIEHTELALERDLARQICVTLD